MKIYVLTVEQAYDGDVLDTIVRVFNNEDEAKEVFNQYRNKEFLPLGWDIDADFEYLFIMCHGDYAQNHVELNIHEFVL
jgi:hypothetical protein